MDLPKLLPSANWFVSRAVKSNMSPEDVQNNPSKAITDLLSGHIWLAFAPHVLNERQHYGSSGKGWTEGRHSYNIVLALTPEIRGQVTDIAVYPLNSSGHGGIIPLSEIKEANQYEKLVINQETARKLLPYTIIHGGDPSSDEPLREIYFGDKAREIITELEGKLEIERKKRNPGDPELPHLSYFSKSGENRA